MSQAAEQVGRRLTDSTGRPGRAALLVALLLVLSCGLRLVSLSGKRCLEHDEAITLLAAAGQQGRYAASADALAGRWLKAAEWQRFQQIGPADAFCFDRIRDDLVATDIHPPLYFWGVHVVGVASGELSARSGGMLNSALHAVAGALLALLAWRLFRAPGATLVCVALWSFAPAALWTTHVARPYELLALLGIAATLCGVEALLGEGRRRWLWQVGLALSLGLGLLTHYQAVFLASAIAAASLASLLWGRDAAQAPGAGRAAGMGVLAAIAAAGVLALVIHPGALQQVASDQLTEFRLEASWTLFGERVSRSATALVAFFGSGAGTRALFWQVAAVALVAFALALPLVRAFAPADGSVVADAARVEPVRRLGLVSLIASICLALIAAQYLSFSSPRHAMGYRYLAVAWPLVAVALVALLRRLCPPSWWSAACGVLLLAVALQGLRAAQRSPALCRGRIPLEGEIAVRRNVVIDTTARGRLGMLLPHLDPQAALFVSFGPRLGRDAPAMSAGLRERAPVLLIHRNGGGNRRAHRDQLFAIASAAGLELQPLPMDPQARLGVLREGEP